MMRNSDNEAVDRVNRQLGELPTSLEVVCRLMMMLRNPTQENEEVVRVLMTDRSLSRQLLTRLAMKDKEKLTQTNENQDIATDDEVAEILFEAVLHMGYRAILRLVSALSVGQILSPELRGYAYAKRDLWLHSVTTGLVCQQFCQVLSDSNRADHDPSLGFIGGLMHDIGKPGLNPDLSHAPEVVFNETSKPTATWLKAEKTACGIDHASLGGMLVSRWKLPKELVNAVRYHHSPTAKHPLAAIVHIADYAARFITATGGFLNFRVKLKTEALEISKLNLSDLERVILHILHDKETLRLYTQF